MNNERVTLAQELHDGIAQDLVVLGFSIDQVISQCSEPAIKDQLRAIRFTTTDLIEKVRTEMHQLRSEQPLTDPEPRINTMHETLRVLQEILRNIEKHSGARTMRIEISDDGVGGVRPKDHSFGLDGIQERITKLNGEIGIESSTQGTRIEVTIPLDR